MHKTKLIALFAVFLSVFIPNAADANQVVSFTLVDAATDADIGPLANGDAVNLALTGTSLNVRANVNGLVGSVRFGLDGSSGFRLESAAPYALAGDTGGDYGSWTPALGSHSLTATPYSKTGGKGSVGIPLSIGFTVIDAPVGNRPPVVVSGPQASPNPVVWPAAAVVSVAASDADGDGLSYAWSQVSGPGAAVFVDAAAASTAVTFSAAGSYTLQAVVSDGQATATGSVDVIVLDDAVVTISGELKRWHKITLTLDGPYALESGNPNPFLDYRMDVVFSNGSLTYTVPGYFAADGDAANSSASQGNKWRAHLSPDLTGTWSYTIRFKQGPNVSTEGGGTALSPYDGLSGFFTVEETDKTGRDLRAKGRLRYVGGHHLQFAGTGEYFLKSGADSPENFLACADFDNTPNNLGLRKTWAPHLSDWRAGDPVWKNGLGKGIIGAVNYLSGKGMNAFSFLTMSVQGDDRNVFMWVSPTDPARYDCSKLDQWEIVLTHADTAGMFLHFKTQEYENCKLLDNGELGTQRKLYYRELVARFGHHLALNWNLGEENQQTDAQRKAMSDYIRDADPYDHLIVVHTEPDDTDLVYAPLLGHPTFDGASLQSTGASAHPLALYWVRQSFTAGRPWAVTHEEIVGGIQPDSVDYWHDQARKELLWGNLMAGGAGVEYYFGWDSPGYDDLSCQDYRTRDHLWDLSRIARDFFIDNAIPFWEMTNSNDLTASADDYVLSKRGETYLLYLKNGGSPALNLSGVSAVFEVKWFDPQNGGGLVDGFITQAGGGGEVSLGVPPFEPDRDWVVLVRASAGLVPDTEAPSVPQNVTGRVISKSVVALSWDPASDNAAVTGYEIFQDGVFIGAVADANFTHTVSGPNTSFTYRVRALDGAGNRSDLSQPVVVILPQQANQTPMVVSGPQASPNPVVLPAAAVVSVAASDADGDALSYAWGQVSGPGAAVFVDAAAASTAVTFSAAGSYTLQVVVSDGHATATGSVSVTAISSTKPQIVSFTLVDAATDADIGPLANGDAVNLALTGTSLNVRANVNGLVGSVRFGLDGSSGFRLESAAPYALAGDTGGDYGSWTPALGSHSLTATPYSKTGGKGTIGIPLSIGFTVIDAPVGNRPPVVVSGPQASPNPVVLPAAAVVSVAASDADGDGLSYAWSQVSGPGAAVFADAAAASTAVTFSAAGSYTLQAVVSDGQATATGSVAVNVISDPSVYLREDFSSGAADDWQVIDEGESVSSWQVIDERLTQTREKVDGWQVGYHLGSQAICRDGHSWGDYTIEANVRATAPADGLRDAVGVLFRYQNSDNYYRLIASRMQGVCRLEKKHAGVFSTLAHDGQGFEVGQDLNIHIGAQGSTLTVYIDHQPRFGAVDSSLASGTIALFAQGPAEFDDIRVASIPPVPKVAIAHPVANQVIITDALSGPYGLPAAAVALNLPVGGGVRFTLDGDPATDQTDFDAPFQVVFSNVSAGSQHRVEATLVDGQNQPLKHPDGYDSDLNTGIGIGGRYLVAMGDSITNGVGDNLLSDNASADGRNLSRGYTPILNDQISARLNRAVTVMNEGIGGATSASGLGCLGSTLERHSDGQIWTVVYGSNDANASLPTLSGVTCSEADLSAQVAGCRGTYKANLRQILLELHRAGKIPVLGLVPYLHNAPTGVDDMIQEYNRVVWDLVAEHGLPAPPDFYSYFQGNPGQLPDDLHPDGSGYAAMALLWYEALLNSGIVNP